MYLGKIKEFILVGKCKKMTIENMKTLSNFKLVCSLKEEILKEEV